MAVGVRLTTRRMFVGMSASALAFTAAQNLAGAHNAMGKRRIPSSAEAIAMVGMGTWQTFDVAGRRALAQRQEVLQAFLAAGGQVIDSSPMYGRSEAVVGKLLPRVSGADQAFVATKVWTRGRARGIAQMEASIRKMGGRVDLMQIHNLVDYRTHLDTLRSWKAQGRIKYIGATHYARSAFDDLERAMKHDDLDFVQLPYSISDREAEKRLLPCARDSGTAVLVMRPFAKGSLFRRVRGRKLPPWAADFDCTSWAQFFLKFLLGDPVVTCPIPATSNPAHMRDNVLAGRGRLPDESTRSAMIAELGL